MVPQIIFIILQIMAISISTMQYIKQKQYINLYWYWFGVIITNLLLYWGNFYSPLFI